MTNAMKRAINWRARSVRDMRFDRMASLWMREARQMKRRGLPDITSLCVEIARRHWRDAGTWACRIEVPRTR